MEGHLSDVPNLAPTNGAEGNGKTLGRHVVKLREKEKKGEANSAESFINTSARGRSFSSKESTTMRKHRLGRNHKSRRYDRDERRSWCNGKGHHCI